jgi:hypothetical protein
MFNVIRVTLGNLNDIRIADELIGAAGLACL